MSQLPNSDPGDSPEQIDQEVEKELAEALQGQSIEQLLDQPSTADPPPTAPAASDPAAEQPLA